MGFLQRLFGGPTQGKEQLEAFKAEAKIDAMGEVSADSAAEFLAHLQTQQEPADDPTAALVSKKRN